MKIPGEIDVQRVRRILEELRRRLADPQRPQIELDYIERLAQGLLKPASALAAQRRGSRSSTSFPRAQRRGHRGADIGHRERLGDDVMDDRVEAGGALALIGEAVINRIVRSGKSRAAASASAMPSITGIWMSVSSRSKHRLRCQDFQRFGAVRARSRSHGRPWRWRAPPSVRRDSSSSAISTRGMAHPCFQRKRRCKRAPARSCATASEVPLAEKSYVDVASFRRRRRQPRFEQGAFAGLEGRLLQHRVPGVDLGALGITHAKSQARQFERPRLWPTIAPSISSTGLPSTVSDVIFTSLNDSPRRLTSQTDDLVELGRLRQQTNHIDAPDHERQTSAPMAAQATDVQVGLAGGLIVSGAVNSLRSQERGLAASNPPSGASFWASAGQSGVPSSGQSPEIEGLSTTGVCCILVFAGESLPLGGGAVGLFVCRRHRRLGREDRGGILRPCQPDFLAPGTAHSASGRAQGSHINGIGRCTMGTNDVHGADLHNNAAGTALFPEFASERAARLGELRIQGSGMLQADR